MLKLLLAFVLLAHQPPISVSIEAPATAIPPQTLAVFKVEHNTKFVTVKIKGPDGQPVTYHRFQDNPSTQVDESKQLAFIGPYGTYEIQAVAYDPEMGIDWIERDVVIGRPDPEPEPGPNPPDPTPGPKLVVVIHEATDQNLQKTQLLFELRNKYDQDENVQLVIADKDATGPKVQEAIKKWRQSGLTLPVVVSASLDGVRVFSVEKLEVPNGSN